MCLCCRCSIISVLVFFSMVLKFWLMMQFFRVLLFGSSDCGLYMWILFMFSVCSVCRLVWVMCECFMLLMMIIFIFEKLLFLVWCRVNMLSRFWVGCVLWLLLVLIRVVFLFVVVVSVVMVLLLGWCMIKLCMFIVFRFFSVLYVVLFLCVDEVDVLKFSIFVFSCCVVSWNELCVCVDGLKNRVYIVEFFSM